MKLFSPKKVIDDYRLYNSFPILKQPDYIKKHKAKIIIVHIIAVFIFDILSFTLKASESFAQNGNHVLAVFMLVLYFAQRVFNSSYDAYYDYQNDLFNQEYARESTAIIMKLCSKTRNKVFKEDDGKQTIMEHAELLRKTKNYLSSIWQFHWKIPTVFSSSITLIIMIISMLLIEFHDNNGWQTIVIMALLLACAIYYFVNSRARIKVMKQFRKKRRDSFSKEDVMLSEINTIEFISDEDFEFHAERFRKQLQISGELQKTERLNVNKVFIKRSLTSSVFMISILLIKALCSKAITLEVVLDVIAVSSVYSTILQKISSITSYVESIADDVVEVETLYSEFKNIYDVYLEEEEKVFTSAPIENILVRPFYATQDPKKTYVLQNNNNFSLSTGDFVLVHGPTGCGKSTLLYLLTGKLRIQNNPILFSNGKNGYLRSIAYQTDSALANNNYALQEIALTEDVTIIDRNKLFEILHGLCLFDTLLERAEQDTDLNLKNLSDEDKIFELLGMLKVSQFSSGQMQRIALAKLLYTMKPEHQVIALDEAFNRLNDSIAKSCATFIREYACRDEKRIVLIATHQVNIIAPLCNKSITFTEVLGGAALIVE